MKLNGGDTPFLTVTEAARALRVSKGTLNQWRHHNRGPAYLKVGGQVRYREEDLLAFVRYVPRPRLD